MSAETGGNCELTEAGKVAVKHGVAIVGHYNVPSRLAADTSQLYARNVLNFLGLLIDKETKELAIDMDDEIIKGTLVTRDGAVVHPTLAPAEAKPAAEPEAGAGEAPEERKSDGE